MRRPIFAADEILTMDFSDIMDFLHSAASSVGAEVTSPWFYLQFRPDTGRRGDCLCGRYLRPRARRHDLAGDELATAAATLPPARW